jgi:hypothetical protein
MLLAGMLVRTYLQPQRNTVYPIFANAAREWNAGVDIYDQRRARPDLDKYRYAPLVAACFSPLAGLPDQLGNVVWRIINGSVYLAGVIVFLRTVFPGRLRLDDRNVTLLAWALVPLSVGSMNNGQPNCIVIGGLLLALSAIACQRWWWAAACLAVPVLFKVYPMAAVMLLLLAYPVRLSWRVGLCLVVGCLLPFALNDPAYVLQIYRSWVEQVTGDNRHVLPLEYSYRDFHVLTRTVGWPMAEEAYVLLQLAMAGLVAAVLLRGRWLGWTREHYLRATLDLGCSWMILFGPATENCTYILLAPTMALSAWQALQPGEPAWKRWSMVAMVSLFVTAAGVQMFPFGRQVSYFLMPLGGLVLFGERLATIAGQRSATPAQVALDGPLAQAA